MLLLLCIVGFPFVAPFFLLMVVREAMGLNPYYLTLPHCPVWQNALWIAALVVLYVGYIWLFVDSFGTRTIGARWMAWRLLACGCSRGMGPRFGQGTQFVKWKVYRRVRAEGSVVDTRTH